jgi:hypothetical protein
METDPVLVWFPLPGRTQDAAQRDARRLQDEVARVSAPNRFRAGGLFEFAADIDSASIPLLFWNDNIDESVWRSEAESRLGRRMNDKELREARGFLREQIREARNLFQRRGWTTATARELWLEAKAVAATRTPQREVSYAELADQLGTHDAATWRQKCINFCRQAQLGNPEPA